MHTSLKIMRVSLSKHDLEPLSLRTKQKQTNIKKTKTNNYAQKKLKYNTPLIQRHVTSTDSDSDFCLHIKSNFNSYTPLVFRSSFTLETSAADERLLFETRVPLIYICNLYDCFFCNL